MPKSLQSRKRQLVRDAIYDAAIELFAKKGFDETTVEEVAEAAGISRRSFFRYFESKDDLLALNTVNCGQLLCTSVESLPASLSTLEVLRETAMAGIRFTESQKHIREVIEIAQRSPNARQAHMSRLMEVEDRLVTSFAARTKHPTQYSQKSLLLAGLCLLINNAAIASWYLGEHKDLAAAVKSAEHNLAVIFCGESSPLSASKTSSGNKARASIAASKPVRKKK